MAGNGKVHEEVSCGRIVKVGIGEGQWRPAIVTRAWPPQTINALVFLDGSNDSSEELVVVHAGQIKGHTLWETSIPHGLGVGQWCWHYELDTHVAQDAGVVVEPEAVPEEG